MRTIGLNRASFPALNPGTTQTLAIGSSSVATAAPIGADVVRLVATYVSPEGNPLANTSCTGLGVLIGGLKRVREHGGSVNLVCTNPQIKKIFDITGLVKIFGIFDDEQSAMKALV